MFGAVRLIKSADPDRYLYSRYGVSFDVCETFSLVYGGFSKNVILFGAEMSSSVYVDDKKRYLNSW